MFSIFMSICIILYVRANVSILSWSDKHYDLTGLLTLQFLRLNQIVMASYLCRNTQTNERSLYQTFRVQFLRELLPTFYPGTFPLTNSGYSALPLLSARVSPTLLCPSGVLITLTVVSYWTYTLLGKVSFSLLLLFPC